MIWALMGFSEASLGLLRSVSWTAQKAPETLENIAFELPDKGGNPPEIPVGCLGPWGPKIIPVLR